jgi:hypothetical protein
MTGQDYSRPDRQQTSGGAVFYLDVLSIEAQVTSLEWALASLLLVVAVWLGAVVFIVRDLNSVVTGCRLITRTSGLMRFDPVTDYCRALEAMSGWEQTARQTHNRRHSATAAACREIAIERLRVALARGIAADQKWEILQASRALLETNPAEAGRADLAELRAQLAGVQPPRGTQP